MPGIHNMTMMMGHFNQSMYPYTYPYAYPYSYPYPHYYQYPYNYYYNYYQQYPYMMNMMNTTSMFPNNHNNGAMVPPAQPIAPMQQQQQHQQQPTPPINHQQYRPNYSQYAASTMNMQKTNTAPSMGYSMPVSASYSMLPSTTIQSQPQLSSIYGSNMSPMKSTYPTSGQPSSLYSQTLSWQPSSSHSQTQQQQQQ
ncbi:hypothetical protein BLA29_011319, partial [Euroglyphus maynei]